MKTLYIECAMGAAGDMRRGAAGAASRSGRRFFGKMNGLGIPGVTVSAEKRREMRCVRNPFFRPGGGSGGRREPP